jgi:sarcosine oxidase subunit alpha
MQINNLAGPLFTAGFYYKTFMYPQKLWMTYEHFIRKAAGLGKSPVEDDPDSYDTINQHCDVLVVGAGPSGLMAALEAGLAGARVIIADEQSEFGGTLLASNEKFDGQSANDWLVAIFSQLSSLRNVKCLTRSTVFGYYDHNFLTILERCTDHLGITASSGPRQYMHKVEPSRLFWLREPLSGLWFLLTMIFQVLCKPPLYRPTSTDLALLLEINWCLRRAMTMPIGLQSIGITPAER